MKLFYLIIATLFAFVASEELFCYQSTERYCNPKTMGKFSCNAKYGAIKQVQGELQRYANEHISTSFQYLLLSTHFSNYEKERPGFAKLYRKLSDEKWEKAIDLIKHLTKRGGKMDFTNNSVKKNQTYELSELESLSKALDIEKLLANNNFRIHAEVTRKPDGLHDPEIGHYLEEEFAEKQADNVRKLSGLSNDLYHLLNSNNDDNALSIFLFDEYLSSHV